MVHSVRNSGTQGAKRWFIFVRNNQLEYCLINNIQTEMKKIPTEAVFSVTGCDLNYYYDKMKKELMVTTLEIGGER